jgi:hypothetical protein
MLGRQPFAGALVSLVELAAELLQERAGVRGQRGRSLCVLTRRVPGRVAEQDRARVGVTLARC